MTIVWFSFFSLLYIVFKVTITIAKKKMKERILKRWSYRVYCIVCTALPFVAACVLNSWHGCSKACTVHKLYSIMYIMMGTVDIVWASPESNMESLTKDYAHTLTIAWFRLFVIVAGCLVCYYVNSYKLYYFTAIPKFFLSK